MSSIQTDGIVCKGNPSKVPFREIILIPNSGYEVYKISADVIVSKLSNKITVLFRNLKLCGPTGLTTSYVRGNTQVIITLYDGSTLSSSTSSPAALSNPAVEANKTSGDSLDVFDLDIQNSNSVLLTDIKSLTIKIWGYRLSAAAMEAWGTSSAPTVSPTIYVVMPIKVNENSIDTIYVNGTKMESLTIDGTICYQNPKPQ